jgi:hypothetical protein
MSSSFRYSCSRPILVTDQHVGAGLRTRLDLPNDSVIGARSGVSHPVHVMARLGGSRRGRSPAPTTIGTASHRQLHAKLHPGGPKTVAGVREFAIDLFRLVCLSRFTDLTRVVRGRQDGLAGEPSQPTSEPRSYPESLAPRDNRGLTCQLAILRRGYDSCA